MSAPTDLVSKSVYFRLSSTENERMHSSFLRCLNLIALVGISSTFLSAAEGANKSQTTSVNLEMHRQEYLARLKIETGKQFCAEDGMLRCFAIPAERCNSFVEQEFSKCLSGTKVPEPVPLTGVDVQIAESVGACIGKKMGKTFEKQFKNAGDCAVRK
ncbi:hypothetical protein BH10BDE1_BH10BDE1_26230 [soil metagenome]